MKIVFKAFLPVLPALALGIAAPLAAQEDVDLAEQGEVGDAEVFEFLSEEEEAMKEFEREMEESFALLGEIFKVDPLTPEQEARLPLAQDMVDTIMPVGTFGVVMKDTMEPMMGAIMGAFAEDPRIRLGVVTGVETDELGNLDDTQAQEALDIFDPEFSARTDKMSDLIVDMIGQLFAAMEPAYRDAYARALTTKFDEAEMTQLLAFFGEPVGAKFARQSFLVQYDPQMMGVMEQMGPAMVEVMPGMMEGFASLEEQFAEARSFSDLSAAERERAARLIGKSESELEALQPPEEEEAAESEEGVI